jgi:ankyrin repeat protein
MPTKTTELEKNTSPTIDQNPAQSLFEKYDTSTRLIIDRVHTLRDLLKAAKENNVEQVKEILDEKRIDVDAAQAFFRGEVRCERTALSVAVQNGRLSTVQALLERGADADGEVEEPYGRAPVLMLAIIHHPKKDVLISRLLSRGADINKALFSAVRYHPENDALISELLSRGADINKALFSAVKYHPENDALISELISRGADVIQALRKLMSQEGFIRTAFSVAVRYQSENDELISELMSQAGDINQVLRDLTSRGKFVDNALYVAIKHQPRDHALISALISRGADANKVVRELMSQGVFVNEALFVAVRYLPENNELILELIPGANANYVIDPDRNYCVLHEAINKRCSKQVIQCLLEHGANPDEKVTVARNGCEQMNFALITLSNPIGWFYLSYLFCASENRGNPFKEKYMDALGLARLINHFPAEKAILAHMKKTNKPASERTPLLNKSGKGNGFFSYGGEVERKSEEPHKRDVIINMPAIGKGGTIQ